MSTAAWLQLLLLIALLAISTPLLGAYLAKVYGGGHAPGDRIFGPIERLVYRLCGVDETKEQRWPTYAISLLAFSFVSVLILYAQLRLQNHLPMNPDGHNGVGAFLSFNTAVSFVTNTNWQNYSGESTMSHLTQMVALTFHNFASAAAGMPLQVDIWSGDWGGTEPLPEPFVQAVVGHPERGSLIWTEGGSVEVGVMAGLEPWPSVVCLERSARTEELDGEWTRVTPQCVREALAELVGTGARPRNVAWVDPFDDGHRSTAV